jgi:hypothetical protein
LSGVATFSGGMNNTIGLSKNTASLVCITPMQGIYIHGLFNIRKSVNWIDVVDRVDITSSKLMSYGLSAAELLHLQPDPHIWVQCKKVTSSDVCALRSWPLHPIDHLKMDIVDFIMEKYPAILLKDLGITYDYLIDKVGMNFSTLVLFGYTWKEWVDLGLTRSHIDFLSARQTAQLFGIPCDKDVKQVANNKFNAFMPADKDVTHV